MPFANFIYIDDCDGLCLVAFANSIYDERKLVAAAAAASAA